MLEHRDSSLAYTALHTFRTTKQAEVFAVIVSFFATYHTVPTSRKLTVLMGWKSRNAGAMALRRLVNDGLLVRRDTPGGRFLLVPANIQSLNAQKPPKSVKSKS